MISSEELVNVTGRGLSGHFKLVHKNEFVKKIGDVNPAKITATRKTANVLKQPKQLTAKNKKYTEIETTKRTAVISSEPRAYTQNISMFDTPVISQSQTSTPFIRNVIVPGAPEIAKRLQRKNFNRTEEIATPRSSLPSKKRRLNKLPE